MIPSSACVCAFVNSVPMRSHHAANRVLSHTYINDIRIAGRDRDRSDGTTIEKAIGNVLPRVPGISRFPNTSAGGTHVVSSVVANDPTSGDASSSTKRPDVSEFQ